MGGRHTVTKARLKSSAALTGLVVVHGPMYLINEEKLKRDRPPNILKRTDCIFFLHLSSQYTMLSALPLLCNTMRFSVTSWLSPSLFPIKNQFYSPVDHFFQRIWPEGWELTAFYHLPSKIVFKFKWSCCVF